MNGFLAFALEKPVIVVVPLCGFLASLMIIRIKRRYIKEGTLFRRSSRSTGQATPDGDGALLPEGMRYDTPAETTRIRKEETTRRNGKASDDSQPD
ncbi:hypothetical protein VSR69_27145 [Paraburkholderia phytofirmans]